MVKNVVVSVFYVYVLTGNFYAIDVYTWKYQLKKATHHAINQSNTVELQTSGRHVCFYCFQRALGIGFKDWTHSEKT